jgi:Response regulator containing CheY-like receiver, AAA-type ATPase, and DNA-binding domains
MARILIADDSPDLLQVLVMILRDAGHQTTAARDGQEALSLLKRIEFDVMITDIVMPNKEGMETIMEARRLVPGLKIIAMSGGGWMSAQHYLDVASKLGASVVLTKPFSGDDVLAAVRRVLSETNKP